MTPAADRPDAPRLRTAAEIHERRRRLRAALLIGLCCFLLYNANGRLIAAGDTYPARYLPFAILHHHTLLLDPIAAITAQGPRRDAFWLVHNSGGHAISLYPVVLPVLIAPLYVPAVAYLNLRGWTDVRFDHMARLMEKFTASLLASLSAALLYLLLRRRASEKIALLLTVAYAFGTTTWMISSQALWQHGMGQLLVVGALLLITERCTAPRAIAAGLLIGLLAGNRPPDAVLAAALGSYGLFWAGRRFAALLAAAAALPAGLVLWYNLEIAGHVAGAYGLIGRASFFDHDFLHGLAGLMISPTRGLLVFSPFLLFLGLAWRHLPHDRAERWLMLAITAGVVLQIALYAKTDWRMGVAFGPRYLTDLLPLLIWMLLPVVTALSAAGRIAFVMLVAVSIAIEAIGAFCYDTKSDEPIFAKAAEPMAAAWQWRNAPFLASAREGMAAPALLLEFGGAFRTVEARLRRTTAAGAEATQPANLAAAATAAATEIRAHQQAEGSWLTTYTNRPAFQEPHPEMNTFLTSLMVDLLDPLPASRGFESSLERARTHLTRQIESNGLVRYHGLPDGPGIGTLGCAITPDTDDTSLVWRIAPAADRERLTTALATIDEYRTREGLYRTWLAPREAYQCLNPGSDPNPADIAIQMHLLLLLAEVRPPAGRALCEALLPLVDADRVWVYYRRTPLVPMLRMPAIHRAGCDLELPDSRMHTTIAGQQLWVSLVRLLEPPTEKARSTPNLQRMRLLLESLAKDDFARLRNNPPLLYHNDLTATVSRYYWSEDAGYALWLRLYDEYERLGR